MYPYPDDEKVAKWVREYAEPNNIVNKNKQIYIDDSSLLFDDTKKEKPKLDNPPPIASVSLTAGENNPKSVSPPAKEEEDAPIKIRKISIKSVRNKPASDGKIRIKRKNNS